VVLGAGTGGYLQITTPLTGRIYQKGGSDSITIGFQTFGGAVLSNILLMVQGSQWIAVPDSTARTVSFAVPTDLAAGTVHLFLIANDQNGNTLADSTSFIVSPAGTLDSIAVNPGSIRLDSADRSVQLSVQGYFLDSGVLVYNDLSAGSAGTTYTLKNGGIVTVSSNGLVNAVKPGMDTLTVTNGSKSDTLTISVDSNYTLATMQGNAINFATIGDKLSNDGPFGLDATTTSGGNVGFQLISGPVTVQNGIVTIRGAGSATIAAFATGDTYFTAPDTVFQTFNITQVNLPLTLLDFTGSLAANGSVTLNWQTTNEVNAGYFVVEHSSNATDFSPIMTVTAKGGSVAVDNYSASDANPWAGMNYYRLRMVDLDGTATYSRVISVEVSGPRSGLSLYPNPVRDLLTLTAGGVYAGKATKVQVMDVTGRVIRTFERYWGGGVTITLDVSGLPAGVYYLRLNGEQTIDYAGFVKQ